MMHTSTMLLFSAKDPMTHKVAIMGRRMLFGISTIFAKALIPVNPAIKRKILDRIKQAAITPITSGLEDGSVGPGFRP